MKYNNQNVKEAIEELKVIYPEVIIIIDSWAMMSHIHGTTQSDEQKKILNRFANAMKIITDRR